MPFITVNGADLYYEEKGDGAETIIFSHGFLFNSSMFVKQIEELSKKYRVIAYDHRGQGKSQVTESGYHIDNLAEDAKQLLDSLKLKQVHFAGLSMGGFVGMRLAARHPEYIKTLTLMNSSSRKTPTLKNVKFGAMKMIVRLTSYGLLAGLIMKSLFGKSFLNDPSRKEEKERWIKHIKSLGKKGYIKNFEGAIRRPNFEELQDIKCPTLIIGGTEDKAIDADDQDILHDGIQGSKIKWVVSGHSSAIEQAEEVTQAISELITNSG